MMVPLFTKAIECNHPALKYLSKEVQYNMQSLKNVEKVPMLMDTPVFDAHEYRSSYRRYLMAGTSLIKQLPDMNRRKSSIPKAPPENFIKIQEAYSNEQKTSEILLGIPILAKQALVGWSQRKREWLLHPMRCKGMHSCPQYRRQMLAMKLRGHLQVLESKCTHGNVVPSKKGWLSVKEFLSKWTMKSRPETFEETTCILVRMQ